MKEELKKYGIIIGDEGDCSVYAGNITTEIRGKIFVMGELEGKISKTPFRESNQLSKLNYKK